MWEFLGCTVSKSSSLVEVDRRRAAGLQWLLPAEWDDKIVPKQTICLQTDG